MRRTLQTSHFPYRGVFPDLQGAVPAFLVEMCVFSAPGIIEFLPALPDSLARGSIDGVWLYTFAKLEHMEWNENGLKAQLTSRRDQAVTLCCRRKGCCIRVNGTALPPVDGDHAEVLLKAGEKTEIEIVF